MPLLYLLALVLMMFVGGMLIRLNPAPLEFVAGFGARQVVVSASILELIGYSVCGGALLAGALSLRSVWLASRERARSERAAEALRVDNAALRRDSENLRSEAKLLGARLAEAEERYAQLEAETRPLLTARSTDESVQAVRREVRRTRTKARDAKAPSARRRRR